MRKTWDKHFIDIARECAKMSTCIRRHVGCVLVSSDHRILSTGFNGVSPGSAHCDPKSKKHEFDTIETCPGADAPPGLSDRGIGGCLSNHAEANALIWCRDNAKVHTCYTTTSPCLSCVKLLLNTSTMRIVFIDEYPGDESRTLWLREAHDQRGFSINREWIKLT